MNHIRQQTYKILDLLHAIIMFSTSIYFIDVTHLFINDVKLEPVSKQLIFVISFQMEACGSFGSCYDIHRKVGTFETTQLVDIIVLRTAWKCYNTNDNTILECSTDVIENK